MPDTIYNAIGVMLLAFATECVSQATILDKACRAAICRIAVFAAGFALKGQWILGFALSLIQSPHGVSPRARRLAMSVWNTGGPKANHSSPIW